METYKKPEEVKEQFDDNDIAEIEDEFDSLNVVNDYEIFKTVVKDGEEVDSEVINSFTCDETCAISTFTEYVESLRDQKDNFTYDEIIVSLELIVDNEFEDKTNYVVIEEIFKN